MSYTNGIGGSHQAISPIAPSAASPVSQVSEVSGHSNGVSASAQYADQAVLSVPASLVAQVSDGADVRTEKVASLQQAIASGTYSVPSSDVADKLIHSLLE